MSIPTFVPVSWALWPIVICILLALCWYLHSRAAEQDIKSLLAEVGKLERSLRDGRAALALARQKIIQLQKPNHEL